MSAPLQAPANEGSGSSSSPASGTENLHSNENNQQRTDAAPQGGNAGQTTTPKRGRGRPRLSDEEKSARKTSGKSTRRRTGRGRGTKKAADASGDDEKSTSATTRRRRAAAGRKGGRARAAKAATGAVHGSAASATMERGAENEPGPIAGHEEHEVKARVMDVVVVDNDFKCVVPHLITDAMGLDPGDRLVLGVTEDGKLVGKKLVLSI